ncbi:MAG: beta-ketoacyl-ACP reductase [Planctomycetaceae bacterium]|nr:beta-ketoacyl-ACP reductase [Planctomycetaceae bacterium]
MSRPTIDFSGRVALVTGGSRGIGRACCERLAEAGASVAVNYRSNETAARETAESVEAAGARALTVRADVSKEAEVARLVNDVQASLGPIDLLVNNAGIFDFVSHAETTTELWQRTLDSNLTGAFHVIWAVKDGMMERGYGRIVNVSSISALAPRPMSIAYAVSKAGMVALTQSVAEPLAAHNVRINAVAPGLIDTEIISGVDQTQLDALIASTPMGRVGNVKDVADSVLFLLSDLSSFTTGQTIVCSGGRVMLP